MSDLEQIVRPSESPTLRPAATTALLVPPKVQDNPTQVWGGAGDSIFQLRAHSHAEVEGSSHTESKRTFDVVRVKNPDDPDQHVDVEVMTAYQARNKIDESRTKLFFDKPKKSENIEILQRDQTRSSSRSPED